MTRREMTRMGSFLFGTGVMAAGSARRIAHTLMGTVVAVDTAGRSLTVHALRQEPWMGALTSVYSVDNSKVLREVRAGDQIMGKVYDGETMVHRLEIVAVSAGPVARN
jgi:hypothetical protein